MTEVTASSIKDLRAMTDAPMMECKKALVEAQGNIEKAIDLLRVKLGKKAYQSSKRATSEGLIATKIHGSIGVLIEVNCETDFVAKDNMFKCFINDVVDSLIENKESANNVVVDIGHLPYLKSGRTIEDERVALSGKLGENILIRRFSSIMSNCNLMHYNHNDRIGVLLEYVGTDSVIAKNVAMHIAAMKPIAISKSEIPKKVVDHEREIASEKAMKSGKSSEIIAKMIDGSIGKFLSEVCLLDQKYVRDESKTVRQVLEEAKLKIISFVVYAVGDKLEHESTDFVTEVLDQAAVV